MSLLKRFLFYSTYTLWMVLFIDFFDCALNCLELEIWFLEGERDERFFFLSLVTSFTMLVCHYKIDPTNESRFYQDSLQDLMSLSV